MPLKMNSELLEPAPRTPKVKSGRLGKGGERRLNAAALRTLENSQAASFRSSDKMEEGRRERKKRKKEIVQALPLETRGWELGKSISISRQWSAQ